MSSSNRSKDADNLWYDLKESGAKAKYFYLAVTLWKLSIVE